MTSIIIDNKHYLNLLERFPRSNKNYLPANTKCKELVLFGSNISSTVNYPRYTSIIRYMVKIPLHLNSLIVGILISDGWLQINKTGNARLGFKQSIDKFEYFFFVFNQLSHFISAYPYINKSRLKGTTFNALGLSTRSLPCFTEFYTIFYKNKVKCVPLDLYELLTYEALAHWICCDGTKTYKGITLQTQSFTIKEIVFIVSILIYKFNLKCTIHKQRDLYVVYISSKSIKILHPYILPYFCQSMRYKLFFYKQ